MINTKLIAREVGFGEIILKDTSGETVARFDSAPYFYIVTGFKSADAYNAHHADEPVKFLVWKREH
ncbi:hypothetical protein Milano_083 [Agrobacterium phage Milano]|nr:hypothetical protein Milano_083 [Agrobacterium phage Milano]